MSAHEAVKFWVRHCSVRRYAAGMLYPHAGYAFGIMACELCLKKVKNKPLRMEGLFVFLIFCY